MRLLTMIAMTLLLTACGQKGPLYLPQDEPAEVSSLAPVSPDLASKGPSGSRDK